MGHAASYTTHTGHAEQAWRAHPPHRISSSLASASSTLLVPSLPSSPVPHRLLFLSVVIVLCRLLCSVHFHCPRHCHVCCPDETATPSWSNDARTSTFPRGRSRCLFLYSRLVYHRRSRLTAWSLSRALKPEVRSRERISISAPIHAQTRTIPLHIVLSN